MFNKVLISLCVLTAPMTVFGGRSFKRSGGYRATPVSKHYDTSECESIRPSAVSDHWCVENCHIDGQNYLAAACDPAVSRLHRTCDCPEEM